MTKEKLKSIFQKYYEHMRDTTTALPLQMGERYAHYKCHHISNLTQVSHLLFMCLEAQKFVDEGRIEKAMRWLGFLQGVFWGDDEFTLEQLKNHSRPDEETK
jgi:hypothetical protein